MKKIIATLAFFAPAVAFAQTESTVTDVNSLSTKLIGIGNTVTYLLVSLGVLFIVYNVVMYFIRGGSDEAGRKAAGLNILWGIVGLFVIVSIWGLVNILTNTFKTAPTSQNIPNFSNQPGNGGIPTGGDQIPQVQ